MLSLAFSLMCIYLLTAEECIQEIKNTEMLSELGKALQNIETETMLPVTAMDHVQQGKLI